MLSVKKPDFLSTQKLPRYIGDGGRRADPYGDLAESPTNAKRLYILPVLRAASIWVEFRDLPEATAKALRQRGGRDEDLMSFFDAARVLKAGSVEYRISKMDQGSHR